jgi:predicted GIY-YIG superfamily endonuclease
MYCSHMAVIYESWGEDKVLQEAQKCKTMGEFKKNHRKAYAAARRLNLLPDLWEFLLPSTKNWSFRDVYVFEFENKSAYVGISVDVENREGQHSRSDASSVYPLIKQGVQYKLKIKHKKVHYKKVKEIEAQTIEKYERLGWKILNRAPAGSLGAGHKVWNEAKVRKLAKKYKHKSEFFNAAGGAVNYARKIGIYDEITAHMKEKHKSWTKAEVKKLAKKFKTRVDFMRGERNAYSHALSNGYLNEVCKHMKAQKESWNNDLIFRLAKKYKKRSDFKKAEPEAYRQATKRGILQKACQHMPKVTTKWLKVADIKREAKKYKYRTAFQKGSLGAYREAQRLDILEEVCKHMKSPWVKYSKAEIQRLAKSCKTRNEFQRGHSSAYRQAKKLGILEEVCKHMVKPDIHNKKWTPEKIIKTAKKYKHSSDFKKACPGAYSAATRLGILKKATAHMKPKPRKKK